MSAFASRRARVAAGLTADGLTGLLVTRLVNVRYLTGFTGSNAALLVRADGSAVFGTDGRYVTQVAAEVPDLPPLVRRDLAFALAETAGPGPVGFEAHHVTVELFSRLSAASAGTTWRPAGRRVEALRMVKEDAEIALLREACRLTDLAFADLLDALVPGVTEREAAELLEARMRRHGADAPAFPSIVAFGENSAIPHHEPTDRPLAAGELVKVDCGALRAGYHADMTRTVVVGPAQDWQRELHSVVAAAAARGRSALAADADGRGVDAAARSTVVEAGFGERFSHGLGHGVGLEIHEAPFLGEDSADTVPLGAVVTVEPGVYLPGRGGVRIEDTCLVGPTGSEPLTTTSRELLVL